MLRAIIEMVETTGIKVQEIIASGGASKSPLWNQIKADVLGVPYLRLARAEFGTWGAAMIAGKAAKSTIACMIV